MCGCVRGQILLNMPNRLAEARKAAEKGLIVDPRDPDCLFVRGIVRYASNDERFDEDLVAAINASGNIQYVMTRLDLLTSRGHLAEVDKAATDILEKLKGSGPQAQQMAIQFIYKRSVARSLMPEKWEGAVEDANMILQNAPDEPALLAVRGFALAALGKETYVDDAKKLATAPGQILQGVLQRGMMAAQMKVPGTWTAFYTAIADNAPAKELKNACYKVVAQTYQLRDQIPDAIAMVKKALEALPNDENGKRALEQLESLNKK
jgi:tetratricopeptide (TPR) repeat protein